MLQSAFAREQELGNLHQLFRLTFKMVQGIDRLIM